MGSQSTEPGSTRQEMGVNRAQARLQVFTHPAHPLLGPPQDQGSEEGSSSHALFLQEPGLELWGVSRYLWGQKNEVLWLLALAMGHHGTQAWCEH